MIRAVLISSAVIALTSAGAFAQAPASPVVPSAPGATVMDAPALEVPQSQLLQSGLSAPSRLGQGYLAAPADQLASRLIGQPIYTSPDAGTPEIGTVSNLVITADGAVTAVVVNVGGFLGIAAKDVALPYSELRSVVAGDSTQRWIIATTADALTAAPAFVLKRDEPAEPDLTPAEQESQIVPGDPNAENVDPSLTTDQPEASPIDRTGFIDFDETTLTAQELVGTPVYGVNDEQIGTISDFVLGAQGGTDAVVVDVGGFLGLGAKPVAVGTDNLNFSVDTNNSRYLFINTTRQQLEAATQFERDTYEAERAQQRLVVMP